MVTLLFVGLIVAAVLLDLAVIRPLEKGRVALSHDHPEHSVDLVVPRSIFFHPSHVWARLEEDGQVTVGIDDLLRTVVGRLDGAEKPRLRDRVRAGDDVMSLRFGGGVLRLPAPVSGVVTRVNPTFGRDPATLRSRPYRDGWLFRVRPVGDLASELAQLRIGAPATEWMAAELERLRSLYAEDVLTGPVEGALERSGEATWRAFQERFLDAGRDAHAQEV